MTATEKRKAVRDKYSELIGRNKYSQAKRDYCFKKHSDGNHYSDCSSSISYSYKMALPNQNFGVLNTVGMYNSKKFTTVPVKISKGQIQNPEILRIGDMLLYAGNDVSRKSAGYVGHVEMYWGYDTKGVHWVVGHGSGTPSKVKMVDKNKSRYNTKSSTPIGNRGLIKVVRFIQDDETPETPDDTKENAKNVKIVGGNCYIRNAPNKTGKILGTAHEGSAYIYAGQTSVDGWLMIIYNGKEGWVSGKYAERY